MTIRELHIETGCSIQLCKRAIRYCSVYTDMTPVRFLEILSHGGEWLKLLLITKRR